jgi:hypothetical protein
VARESAILVEKMGVIMVSKDTVSVSTIFEMQPDRSSMCPERR